jgi:hypothetical protein
MTYEHTTPSMVKRTFTIIILNDWKTITKMPMRATILMKDMVLGVKINITKKMMRMNKILSIILMKHSFAINKCKKRLKKVRS